MSNIHSLSSLRRNSNDDDERKRRGGGNNDDRFVGGIDARGGGSGLAVQPKRDSKEYNEDDDEFDEDEDDEVEDEDSFPSSSNKTRTRRPNSNSGSNSSRFILDSVRAHATQGTDEDGPIRRTITMYRDGFVVDYGPYRRLDDPQNAEFLTSLARGITPRELIQDNGGTDSGMVVGLVDKRDRDYSEEDEEDDSNRMSSSTKKTPAFQSFSGQGSTLGSHSSSNMLALSLTGGIITPPSTPSVTTLPPMDNSLPSTSIQIRLLNGKRLVAKVNLQNTVSILVQHIRSSGQEGSEPYVLSSGFPPRILEDLNLSIEAAGLSGAQVIQKKM